MQRGIIEAACHDENEQHPQSNGKIWESGHHADRAAHKTEKRDEQKNSEVTEAMHN